MKRFEIDVKSEFGPVVIEISKDQVKMSQGQDIWFCEISFNTTIAMQAWIYQNLEVHTGEGEDGSINISNSSSEICFSIPVGQEGLDKINYILEAN